MEENEMKINELQNKVKHLHTCYLVTMAIFVITTIGFQMQYSRMTAYYQSTVELNRQILIDLTILNSELQDITSTYEGQQIRWN